MKFKIPKQRTAPAAVPQKPAPKLALVREPTIREKGPKTELTTWESSSAGRLALARMCEAKGLHFSLINTYSRSSGGGQDITGARILVGTLYDEVMDTGTATDGGIETHSPDATDLLFLQLAERLEAEG